MNYKKTCAAIALMFVLVLSFTGCTAGLAALGSGKTWLTMGASAQLCRMKSLGGVTDVRLAKPETG